ELHRAIEQKKPIEDSIRALDVLLEAIRNLRLSPVPGLVVESALLTLCTSTPNGRPEVLPAKATEKIEKQAKEVPREDSAAAKQEKKEESPLSAAEIEAPEVTQETITAAWEQILEETVPASVRMSLKNGELQHVAGTTVTVGFTSSFHRDKVAATEASRTIEQVMHKIFKRSLKIECVLEKDREKDGAKENVVNLADAAAEVF
ncbi:MAG: hypothetical protein PHO20_02440, partial [Candidatus Peribacteraceae bacterium]|nr:hypothetical protein [Candidatus Peribacteraceae bacterium]